jgi:hypothetical protein
MLWSLPQTWVAETAAAEPVDRVVAVVDGEPLLASEVAFDAEVDDWLGGPDPGLGLDPADRAIRRSVVRRAAERVTLDIPPEDVVRAEVERMRQASGSATAWASLLARYGLDELAVAVWARRRLIVSRWIDRQIAGLPASEQGATASSLVDALVNRVAVRRIEIAP